MESKKDNKDGLKRATPVRNRRTKMMDILTPIKMEPSPYRE